MATPIRGQQLSGEYSSTQWRVLIVARASRKAMKSSRRQNRLGTGIYESSKQRRAEREYWESMNGPVTVRRMESPLREEAQPESQGRK